MGQVLTFPTLKAASRSAEVCLETRASGKPDNVVLFDGVFIEYHDKSVIRKHVGAVSWVSDLNTPPRRGQR